MSHFDPIPGKALRDAGKVRGLIVNSSDGIRSPLRITPEQERHFLAELGKRLRRRGLGV